MSEVNAFGKHRKPGGTFIFTDKETGKVTEYHSAQCVHCSRQWQVIPGSGRLRGFCHKCQGILCGDYLCMKECVYKEAQLELMEGNKKAISRYGHTETARRILAEQERGKRIEEQNQKIIERLEKKLGKSPLIFK